MARYDHGTNNDCPNDRTAPELEHHQEDGEIVIVEPKADHVGAWMAIDAEDAVELEGEPDA